MPVDSIGTIQNIQNKGSQGLIERSFVLLPDKDIRRIARNKTEEQYPNTNFRKKMNAVFYSIPLLGGISAAASTKGSPARKAFAGTKSGALWIGAIGILGLYDSVTKKIMKKSPALSEKYDKHPVAGCIADLTFAFLSVDAGTKLINKGLSLVNTPKKLVKDINNSKLALEYIPKMKNGIKNTFDKVPNAVKQVLPAIKKGGSFVVKNAPLLAVGGLLLAGIGRSLKKDKNYNQNYGEIKNLQLNVAQNIISKQVVNDI